MAKYNSEKYYYEEAWVSNAEIIIKQMMHEGLNKTGLKPEDIFTYDQYDHVGGIKNTKMLATKIQLEPGMKILDLGGGMGGSARFLAYSYGCRVCVVDLIWERCDGGMKLTKMVGLHHLITFITATGQCLPFRDTSFDVVWSQDCFDSIADKSKLLRECHRVLKPRGQLIFTDHLKGSKEAIPDGIYLWQDDIYKIAFEDYQRLLNGCGFRLEEGIDLTRWAKVNTYRLKNKILKEKADIVIAAQGKRYYERALLFVNSFLSYLEKGMIQYGFFRATRL